MAKRWNSDTTIKFIREYKKHTCLWDFKSENYKNKRMRESAYNKLVEAMNIEGFNMIDVKNKIRNLRSTYCQELIKLEKSKRTSIIWLKEFEPVYRDTEKGKFLETILDDIQTETETENTDPFASLETSSTFSPCVISAKPSFREEHSSNTTEEDIFDIFGRSVSMQMRKLSSERALLAQSRIQSVLTELGIEDIRDSKRSSTSVATYTPQDYRNEAMDQLESQNIMNKSEY